MKYPAVTDWLIASTELEPELIRGRAVDFLIEQRMREIGIGDGAAYLDRLQSDRTELEHIVEGIAVPETSLFRYPASFEYLVDALRGRLARAAPTAPLRMMSLACATGEEPCSMAIAASHAGWPWSRIEIGAVDRSERCLARARSSRYVDRAVKGVVPDWAHPLLSADDGEIQVDARVTGCIRYQRTNVLDLPPTHAGYDVIFCRNLAIYLDADARRRLTHWLRASLAADGLLFLGHADHGPPITVEFQSVGPPGAFAFAVAPAAACTPAPPLPPARRRREAIGRPARLPVSATVNHAASRSPRRNSPVSPAPSLEAARALADRGQLEPALAMTRAIIDRDGPNVQSLELLGTAHLARGELRDAHACFFRAVYLDPTHASSLLQLALLSDRLGDPVQAERYRRRATRAAQPESRDRDQP